MKLLFDFLPLAFFFATYKIAGAQADQGAAFATHWLGALVQGGVVGSTEAPALLATVVVLFATLLQVIWMKSTGRKIDLMLWVGLGLIVVFGGLTVWFHNQMFIMWKPSITFWLLGLVFWGSSAFFHKNLPRATLGAEIELPDTVWQRLNFSYVAFFALMGLLNLWVVYFLRDYWVSFHTFFSTGLMGVFFIGQVVYLNKHLGPEQPADKPAP
ncbi:MAG: septation protein A [Betaproteobacteria bacterium]